MRAPFIPATLALLLAAGPALAQGKKAKAPSAAQLKAELKKAEQERDDLKARLTAAEGLQTELASAQKARELAKSDAKEARAELDSLKATLKENQAGFEPLLKDLKQAKEATAECAGQRDRLKLELEALQARLGPPEEGALVPGGDDITPARAINLNRVTPRLEGWSKPRGVVVVNVLVDQNGEVVGSRLLQGLPGEGEKLRSAEIACVEAAKKLVFDPARTKEGTKVKVWQGVGFWLE
ncbi:MAG TPA: hypothetical protein VJ623_03505 [Holophagaceae bacterium]|nr:hypothetical protein [Holophagaceae bacterium]